MSRNYQSTRHPGVYYRTLANGQRRYTIMISERGKATYRAIPGNETDAIRARAELLTRKGRGEKIAPSKVRFAEYATRWLDQEKHRLDERTIDDYQRQLRLHLIPAFGHLKLSALNEDRIAAFVRDKTETHKGSTISGMLTPLSRILNRAVRQGVIAQNPMRRLEREERPKVLRKERRILDRDEIGKLIRACPAPYREIVAAGIFTGLRISELLGLQWGDVDLDRGLVTVRAQLSRMGSGRKRLKTEQAAREVLLAPEIVAELRRHRLASRFSGENDFVFPTSTGRPQSQSNVLSRGLHKAWENAGLRAPRPRFHDLRHTYVSLLIAGGANVVFVCRQIGHADPSFTLKEYADLWERAEQGERHVAILSGALGGAIPEGVEAKVSEGGFGR